MHIEKCDKIKKREDEKMTARDYLDGEKQIKEHREDDKRLVGQTTKEELK